MENSAAHFQVCRMLLYIQAMRLNQHFSIECSLSFLWSTRNEFAMAESLRHLNFVFKHSPYTFLTFVHFVHLYKTMFLVVLCCLIMSF